MKSKNSQDGQKTISLGLEPFAPNPHTLPSELSGIMKIYEGNDVEIQILNSDYLSTSPQIQKSDSVVPYNLVVVPFRIGTCPLQI